MLSRLLHQSAHGLDLAMIPRSNDTELLGMNRSQGPELQLQCIHTTDNNHLTSAAKARCFHTHVLAHQLQSENRRNLPFKLVLKFIMRGQLKEKSPL